MELWELEAEPQFQPDELHQVLTAGDAGAEMGRMRISVASRSSLHRPRFRRMRDQQDGDDRTCEICAGACGW